MSIDQLLTNAEKYVRNLFFVHMQPEIKYHDLQHTERVAFHTSEISRHSAVTYEEHTALMLAAWFHDTGQLFGAPQDHEQRSVEIMETFMAGYTAFKSLQPLIRDYILATKIPVNPKTLPEMIICDADTYHLGTSDFLAEDAKVWRETELRTGVKQENPYADSLHFLLSHTYFSDYCKNLLNDGKKKNIDVLKKLKKIHP